MGKRLWEDSYITFIKTLNMDEVYNNEESL